MPRQPQTRDKPKVPRRPTASSLENAAAFYLQRFASSEENLRRVLSRKVARAMPHHPDVDRGLTAEWIEAVIVKYRRLGFLDDAAYAAMKARSLHRRGKGLRFIRQELGRKGVAAEQVDAALAELDAETAPDTDPDLAAACAYCRRRRIGPYRAAEARAETRRKDMAALARQGFSPDVAFKLLDAPDAEAAERLARGEDPA